MVAYLVAVEAVTNVARHAGVAAADVEFALHPDGSLGLTVRDHGRSARPWQAEVGLGSMRERVEEIGRTLVADGGPDGGLVAARLPLRTSMDNSVHDAVERERGPGDVTYPEDLDER